MNYQNLTVISVVLDLTGYLNVPQTIDRPLVTIPML